MLQNLEQRLLVCLQHVPDWQQSLADILNCHALRETKHLAQKVMEGHLFSIEVWVPSVKVTALHRLVKTLVIDCERIAVEKADQVPTYMENRGFAKVGEDLVHVYDAPSPQDRDPSRWILLFFSLFFAMIVSDAGYGAIYLSLALLLKWRFRRVGQPLKRAFHLLFLCGCTTLGWGVLNASYFGLELSPHHWVRRASLLQYLAEKKADYHLKLQDDVYHEYVRDFPTVVEAKTGRQFLLLAVQEEGHRKEFVASDEFADNLMMEASFLIGIIHIALSFLRYLTRNWAGLGWVFFMIGGYLYFPSILQATTLVNVLGLISKPVAHVVGFQFTFGGIGLAVLAAVIQQGLKGCFEVLTAIQVFSDVLSYLRLYALALGGMVMAHTFNNRLGLDLGLIQGLIIILTGHLTNLGLATMGGVIHGLRLNFLEWYHYCFEGGGKMFNPLKLTHTKHHK
jgi:V/A-type H+-transporting ATPase subunit I